ncbi:hypothetical protein L3V83_09125 [Thiotrichales bacterium 19X7-9]|nr:hypothetical protein [Thiotrichales bacterium 19X7-9]
MKMQSENNLKYIGGGNGFGFFIILFFIFLVLKLCGVIAWSWWWVFAPFWLPPTAFLLILTALHVVVTVFGLIKKYVKPNS